MKKKANRCNIYKSKRAESNLENKTAKLSRESAH